MPREPDSSILPSIGRCLDNALAKDVGVEERRSLSIPDKPGPSSTDLGSTTSIQCDEQRRGGYLARNSGETIIFHQMVDDGVQIVGLDASREELRYKGPSVCSFLLLIHFDPS